MEIEMIRIMKTMKNNQPTLFLLEKKTSRITYFQDIDNNN